MSRRAAIPACWALFLFPCVGAVVWAGDPGSTAWRAFQFRAADAMLEAHRAPVTYTPPPAGVTELDFRDFYERVVGDRGLVYSEKLQSLAGQRVRIQGHMVKEPSRPRGVFMLTPWPTKVENDGFCVLEDLPPATLHVLLPESEAQRPSPYIAGPLVFTGVLEIGPAATPDGRNASVRLRLDTPLSSSSVIVHSPTPPDTVVRR